MSASANTSASTSWFITGTDTGIGKTLMSTALLHALGKQGLRAAGMKPVAAGTEWRDGAWHNEDSDALMAAATIELPPELVTPYLLHAAAAPHIAAAQEGVTIEPDVLRAAHTSITQQADAVVVEGVGGFRVPLNDRFDSADLAQAFGLPVILVVGLRLGCINHALLSADAIAARGLVLAGWIANCIDAEMLFPQENIAALSARLPAPLLGVVPRLPQPSAAEVCAHLDFTSLPGWPGKRWHPT